MQDMVNLFLLKPFYLMNHTKLLSNNAKLPVAISDMRALIETCENLQGSGNAEQAAQLYGNWLADEQQASSPVVWFSYGALLQGLGNLKGAMSAYEQCLRLKPGFGQALVNLGLTCEKAGLTDTALQYWGQLASQYFHTLDHDLNLVVMALNHMGRVQENLKNYQLAENALTHSLRLMPQQPHVIQHWVHIRQKACRWPVYQALEGVSTHDMLMATSPLAMLAALTSTQLNQLSSKQIAGLNAVQVKALTSSQLNNLSTSLLQAIEAADLAAIATNVINTLSASQAALLSTAQMAGLSSGQLGAMTTDQLNNLGTTQIKALTSNQIKALSSAQLNNLQAAQLAVLDATSFATLSTAAVAGMTSTQLGQLSTAQVAKLTSTAIAKLNTTQLQGLTTAQLAALSSSQIKSMGSAQLNALNSAQILAIDSSDIAAINMSTLAGMTTTQLSYLSTTQVAALGTAQKAGLTSAQIAAL
jgi:tetratricopeptide (TPR) repeat protein